MTEFFLNAIRPMFGGATQRTLGRIGVRAWSLGLGILCWSGIEVRASDRLTLAEAKATALKAHPRITAADYRALAAKQAEMLAALMPDVAYLE